MGASATLSIRLGRLRSRFSQQKDKLEHALEMNRQLASRDALTGLPNGGPMVDLLAREQPWGRPGGGPTDAWRFSI